LFSNHPILIENLYSTLRKPMFLPLKKMPRN
jgi:hypothetical protein